MKIIIPESQHTHIKSSDEVDVWLPMEPQPPKWTIAVECIPGLTWRCVGKNLDSEIMPISDPPYLLNVEYALDKETFLTPVKIAVRRLHGMSTEEIELALGDTSYGLLRDFREQWNQDHPSYPWSINPWTFKMAMKVRNL